MSGFWNKLLVLSLLAIGFAVTSAAQPRRAANSPNSRISIAEISRNKALGVSTAPIKIEDFTDFQCPACRELYMATLRPLINDYVATGKVYLVHHDFPLAMHPYSHQAAYYADAAAAIGEFEPVERALFMHQPEWEASGKIMPFLGTVLNAEQLKQVEELARTREVQDAVAQDVRLGQQLNVQQTPTMFITFKGKRTPVVGVVQYSILRGYLTALLRQ
ncbi:MAG: thioredoxin domain-containing protein [Acidobacteriota bacterium]|nr:thioredoxin domain-containing protein [Acidobacteriota bacterium]